MTVLAFVCLFLPLSCSVKEDRSRCPFVLTVDLSLAERPQAFCDSVDVYAFDGSSDCFSRVVFSLAEKGACTFELLRGKFNLCGFFNFSSSLGDVSSGRLAIPIGSQADSLYAFAYDIEFSLERMIVYPRLYKQFATMSLVFDGIGEAEQFAAEDAKIKEKVEVRNQADQMVYQAEKTLGEVGDKIPESEKAPIQAGIDKLKETLKGEDTDAIKAATDELTQLFYKMSEKLYQQQAPQGDPNGGFNGGFNGGAQPGGDPNGGQQYYDADYKVVDEDENKQ